MKKYRKMSAWRKFRPVHQMFNVVRKKKWWREIAEIYKVYGYIEISFATTAMPTPCWRWMGAVDTKGYGRCFGSAWLAHRVVYTVEKGHPPEDRVLDHLCRNRWCVNPDHLEPVTMRENCVVRTDLSVSGINLRKTHCKNGHPLVLDERPSRQHQAPSRYCKQCTNSGVRARQVKYDAAKRAARGLAL